MISGRTHSLLQESRSTAWTSGVTLLLLGFCVAQQLASPSGSHFQLMAVTAASALALSLAVKRLHSRLQVTDALERQLHAFGQSTKEEGLLPILDASAIGSSWNKLIKLVENHRLDRGLQRRVEQLTETRGTEKFARVLRSVSEGIAISDRQGKINYVNPAWMSLVGGQADSEVEIVGCSLINILAAIDFQNWDEVRHAILDGYKPIRVELRRGVNVADGVLQISRVPLEGRLHEAEGYVWSLLDITQNALAREAHEQFLASATHELRTPLTNITAYSESLIDMDDISPAQQKEFFNVIHAEASRLGRLLNQLLDIQQLEAGSMTIKSSPFDIQRMVQEVQEHILPLVEDKQLKLTCRIAPDLKNIQADKEKIISCLVNLLGNAVKYTPAGGEIRLNAEQLDAFVSIGVEDTGIGIAEHELPKIFERFYRCQDERVTELEGNGLGLAFALEVARLHGGELRVESQLDKGTKFTLRLPVIGNA